MNKPIRAFTGQILHIDDVVVYLKTERTSINTIKKCKFIGEITEFVDTKVKIRRLSPPRCICYTRRNSRLWRSYY